MITTPEELKTLSSRDLLPLKLNPDALVFKDSLKNWIMKLEEKMFSTVQKSAIYPEVIAEYQNMFEKWGYVCTEEGKDRYLDFDGINYPWESEEHKTQYTDVFVSYEPTVKEYAWLQKNLKDLENQIMYFKSYLSEVK